METIIAFMHLHKTFNKILHAQAVGIFLYCSDEVKDQIFLIKPLIIPSLHI
jgi:hypothetical protein